MRSDTIPPTAILTPDLAQIVLLRAKGQYHRLPARTISTLTECTDPQTALWEHLVMTHAGDRHVARLHCDAVEALVGSRPRRYTAVQRDSADVIAPTLSANGSKDYWPASLTHSGHGRSSEYRITVPSTGVRHTYTLTGSALARYYRSQLAALAVIDSRRTPAIEALLSACTRLTLDLDHVRRECRGSRDAADVRRAMAALSRPESLVVEQTGRIHTALTQIPRTMRPYLRLDGQPMVALDLVSAHPSLLLLLAIKEWELPQCEIEALRTMIGERLVGKRQLLRWMNDVHGAHSQPEVERYVSRVAPQFLAIFATHRKELGTCLYKLYSHLESQVMCGVIEALTVAGYSQYIAGREHDGLRVTESESSLMLVVAQRYLDTMGDALLRLRVKHPQSEREAGRADWVEARWATEYRERELLVRNSSGGGGGAEHVCAIISPLAHVLLSDTDITTATETTTAETTAETTTSDTETTADATRRATYLAQQGQILPLPHMSMTIAHCTPHSTPTWTPIRARRRDRVRARDRHCD